ncbi:MAG: nuclear transport factor 2 family protein [Hyphomicrobium sp.]|uniref:nuclear transport factor 2 family protein n=1 Tax=Hyphomicrobium sp. TaxID=82 RepID=UPI0039E641E3
MESAQEAWNSGSVEGVLDKYVDDIVYTTNTGGPNGESLTIRGKENVRLRFQKAMEVIDSRSHLESARWENGLVRTRLTAELRHRATGHCLQLSLRQVLRFRGFRIAEMQDFHDAAKLAAFWRLIGDPLSRIKNSAESV